MASKILIIGGTGYIGKFIVGASVKLGHPTFALVRDTAFSDPAKAKLLEGFASAGVTLFKGDLHDHESLVKAIKEVDVVISAVGFTQLADQIKIIDAIKEVGPIERFVPSEFGFDLDRVDVIEPAASILAPKIQIRRAIEAEGIPYTNVSSNYFAGHSLPTLAQSDSSSPPKDKVFIYGDGNTKAIFVNEEDIATYTIRAVDDPRTLNKVLYIRPPGDIYTHNELVSLWEKKTGKTLERIYLTEEEVLQKLETEAPFRIKLLTAINYSVFIKGETTRIKIDPSFGVEASELYPDVKYTTAEEYISNLV